MQIHRMPFNIYYFLVLPFLLLSSGCKTTEEKKESKEMSTLRFHLEAAGNDSNRNQQVPILRENPVLVNAAQTPFLDEYNVEFAEVVDTAGGFAIKVKFDSHGTLVLDSITAAYRGRRIAIHSQFGESRWLAAPIFGRGVAGGVILFTPDASREEAERIVRGLNNFAKRVKKKS